MITAGCDVGSLTAKAVILDEKRVVGHAVAKSLANPGESARMVMKKALEGTELGMDALDGIVGTGYGREKIDFVHAVRSEIACHARGRPAPGSLRSHGHRYRRPGLQGHPPGARRRRCPVHHQ